jgi:hypothetical protein
MNELEQKKYELLPKVPSEFTIDYDPEFDRKLVAKFKQIRQNEEPSTPGTPRTVRQNIAIIIENLRRNGSIDVDQLIDFMEYTTPEVFDLDSFLIACQIVYDWHATGGVFAAAVGEGLN